MKTNAKTTPHATHPEYTLTTWQDGEHWFYQVKCPAVGSTPARSRLGAAYPDESTAIGHGTYRMGIIIKADNWDAKNSS